MQETTSALSSRSSAAVYQLSNGFIDITQLQEVWLKRVNDLRKSRGRDPYMLHPLLHKTAADRSETMKRT